MSIYTYSDPSKVRENANYWGYDVNKLFISDKPNKKYYYVKPDGKKVYFGQMGYEDYTKHMDFNRAERYLARASNIKGKWKDNKYSPNNLSIRLLWSDGFRFSR